MRAAACVACRAPGSGPLPPPACTRMSLGTAEVPKAAHLPSPALSPAEGVLMQSPWEPLLGSGSACDLLVQAVGWCERMFVLSRIHIARVSGRAPSDGRLPRGIPALLSLKLTNVRE